MSGEQENKNVPHGIQNIDDGLFKNLTYFADAVWEIDVDSMTVWILYDKLNENMFGTKISLNEMHSKLEAYGHSNVVARIHSYYTKEFLLALKENFCYENQFVIGSSFHTLQYVMTPHFNAEGKVARVYVTTRDVSRIVTDSDRQNEREGNLYHSMVDVLSRADMGLWGIVIGDGDSKFYPDQITAELVGSPKNLTPEGIYRFWHERVEPEYLESVHESVQKMLAGIPSEVIYLYNHPEHGKITVRCGGLVDKKYSGRGIKISGYHQDISEYNEKLLKQVELSNALFTRFHSVLSIDIPKCRGKILWDPERFFFRDEHTHFKFDDDYFKSYLKPDSYRANKKNLDVRNLGKVLSGKKILSMELEGATKGWFRISIVPSKIEDDGTVSRCIFFAEDINDEKQDDFMRTELLRDAVSREKREKETLRAVASTYLTMHLIDFRENRFYEINAVDRVHEYVNAHNTEEIQEIIWGVMNSRMSNKSREDVFRFTDFSTLYERLSNRTEISCEVVNVDNVWVRLSFVKVDDDKDRLGRVVFLSKIIDDVKKKEEHLVEISTTDPLTGLLNRYAFERHISSFEGYAVPKDVWFVCIDVNGLKVTNDTKGHAAGDELIIGVAECIQSSVSTFGKAYRIGGDEFFLILTGTEKEIRHVMFSLENKRLMWRGKFSDSLSFSRGVVCASELPGCMVNTLEREADQRMYVEKRKFYEEKENRYR